MDILATDSNVKAIFFNIFGGITRTDDVAQGIAQALDKRKPSVPIVIRLTGTNEDKAREILTSIGLNACTAMDDGVRQAITAAGGTVREPAPAGPTA
jgi:succinyl-CoA synthetase beta subunit